MPALPPTCSWQKGPVLASAAATVSARSALMPPRSSSWHRGDCTQGRQPAQSLKLVQEGLRTPSSPPQQQQLPLAHAGVAAAGTAGPATARVAAVAAGRALAALTVAAAGGPALATLPSCRCELQQRQGLPRRRRHGRHSWNNRATCKPRSTIAAGLAFSTTAAPDIGRTLSGTCIQPVEALLPKLTMRCRRLQPRMHVTSFGITFSSDPDPLTAQNGISCFHSFRSIYSKVIKLLSSIIGKTQANAAYVIGIACIILHHI